MVSGLKIRTILAVGGLLTGLAGVAIFSWGSALLLSHYIGMIASTIIIGALLLILSVLSIWIAFKPSKSVEGEAADMAGLASAKLKKISNQALDSMTGVPVSAATRMVEERPIITLAGVALTTFVIARAPENAVNTFSRIISRIT